MEWLLFYFLFSSLFLLISFPPLPSFVLFLFLSKAAYIFWCRCGMGVKMIFFYGFTCVCVNLSSLWEIYYRKKKENRSNRKEEKDFSETGKSPEICGSHDEQELESRSVAVGRGGMTLVGTHTVLPIAGVQHPDFQLLNIPTTRFGMDMLELPVSKRPKCLNNFVRVYSKQQS